MATPALTPLRDLQQHPACPFATLMVVTGPDPFRYFHHCHRVREEIREGAAGSVVSDVLAYELPMGLLGDLLNWLAMKRQIRALFAYRQRMLPLLLSRS